MSRKIFCTHKKIPTYFYAGIFRTLLISWRRSCFRGNRTGPASSPPIVEWYAPTSYHVSRFTLQMQPTSFSFLLNQNPKTRQSL